VWNDVTKYNVPIHVLNVYAPAFGDGQSVSYNGDDINHKVKAVLENGFYKVSGVEGDVSEDKLDHYYQVIQNEKIVSVTGKKDLFKIISYSQNVYTLDNIFNNNNEQIQISRNLVLEKYEPDYQIGEGVKLCSDNIIYKVKSVDREKYTYGLLGKPGVSYPESHLCPADTVDDDNEDDDDDDEDDDDDDDNEDADDNDDDVHGGSDDDDDGDDDDDDDDDGDEDGDDDDDDDDDDGW
jgi:hypothetical protein